MTWLVNGAPGRDASTVTLDKRVGNGRLLFLWSRLIASVRIQSDLGVGKQIAPIIVPQRLLACLSSPPQGRPLAPPPERKVVSEKEEEGLVVSLLPVTKRSLDLFQSDPFTV